MNVEGVEAALVGVRAAWRRGDQTAIADALINQASLLETLGVKLLAVAGNDPAHLKRVELYGNMGLRALEQARKTLDTLAGLRKKPSVQTNVQVNVAGSNVASTTNEVFEVDRGE
jgi:hypothetical protein